jgi:hypothetical protein
MKRAILEREVRLFALVFLAFSTGMFLASTGTPSGLQSHKHSISAECHVDVLCDARAWPLDAGPLEGSFQVSILHK